MANFFKDWEMNERARKKGDNSVFPIPGYPPYDSIVTGGDENEINDFREQFFGYPNSESVIKNQIAKNRLNGKGVKAEFVKEGNTLDRRVYDGNLRRNVGDGAMREIGSKARRSFVAPEEESVQKAPRFGSAYTTWLFNREQAEKFVEAHNGGGLSDPKIRGQFFDVSYLDPYSYGQSPDKVKDDMFFLEEMKKLGFFDEEVDGDSIGRKFEEYFPLALISDRWLNGGNRFSVGRVMRTHEYDDVFNHADFYTQVDCDGIDIPIAFDITANSRQDNLLLKLDRSSSNSKVNGEELPFGFGLVKYCLLRDKYGNDQTLQARMPLFKVAVDFDSSFEIANLEDDFDIDDVRRLGNLLKQTGNEKLFSEEDEVIFEKNSFNQDEMKRAIGVVERARMFQCLRMSFFTLSEMYEQADLILINNERNKRNEVVRARRFLSQDDVDKVETLKKMFWQALSSTMRSLAKINGAGEEFSGLDDEHLYEKFKRCAGVDNEEPTEEDRMRGHFYGLRTVDLDGVFSIDRCYVNMMKAIEDERDDIVYRSLYVKKIKDSLRLATSAGKFREEFESAEDKKAKAKEVFSRISFNSYLDHFDELFELSGEFNVRKIFLSRLGMGDFDFERGIFNGGYVRQEDGTFEKTEKPNEAKELHDSIIERMFDDQRSREKYFQGKNRGVVARCFSDEFLSQDENIIKLIRWQVDDKTIEGILKTNMKPLGGDEEVSEADLINRARIKLQSLKNLASKDS